MVGKNWISKYFTFKVHLKSLENYVRTEQAMVYWWNQKKEEGRDLIFFQNEKKNPKVVNPNGKHFV